MTKITPAIALLLSLLLCASTFAQTDKQKPKKQKKKKKAVAEFKWNTPSTKWFEKKMPMVKHKTFESPSMKVDVGYCIYLPPNYDSADSKDTRYPVVYYLHGGRPGGEWKSARLANDINSHIVDGSVAPMIYVFVNGGPVSHYNMPGKPEAQGADVFIKELIPHVDETYRTIATRAGRGIEGFSQGGRGTARLMFRYPKMFCSASPGGGGHATEKKISENGGKESEKLVFAEGDNTWDLAEAYAEKMKADPNAPKLKILVHVGDKGFNYKNNLQWMEHLTSLGIEHQSLIVPGAGHNAKQIYASNGLDIMQFHAKNFGK